MTREITREDDACRSAGGLVVGADGAGGGTGPGEENHAKVEEELRWLYNYPERDFRGVGHSGASTGDAEQKRPHVPGACEGDGDNGYDAHPPMCMVHLRAMGTREAT